MINLKQLVFVKAFSHTLLTKTLPNKKRGHIMAFAQKKNTDI